MVYGDRKHFGSIFLTLGIHLISMVGQNIYGWAAIHGGEEALLARVWTRFESFVRQAIVSHSANFYNMHVSACLQRAYVFVEMNSESLGKHQINLSHLVWSTPFFMCSKFNMISLRYHGAGSQVKACYVRT